MNSILPFRMVRIAKPWLALIIAVLVLGVARPRPTVTAQETAPGDDLKALEYRLIGPAWGGRVSRVAGVAGTPVFYATTAGGGVWKSSDHGVTWQSIWESPEISSIGSIAVAPSDPNVIYVGSGEANIRGNVAAGNGIYKSVDAGKTWQHVWKQEGQIGTMVVHPTNPEVAFAAVLGHAFGPNPERGVYRTTDGGKSWQQVLKKDEQTGASDVAIDPSNPNIVFAGLWQARRYPWDLQSGGPGSGLYASRDGGSTWKQLREKGLPDGIWGKVGIAVAPSDGRRVYALIEAEKGGLFRSDDGGESWQLINPSRALRQRAWYYTTITVHPTNPNEAWFPSVPMLKTIDGGKSLESVRGIHHGDHHDVWFDPTNPKRMITGNDGGVDISSDGGRTWMAPALPISQFYHVSADSRTPFSVAGSMQDIGTAQGPSNSLRSGGIRNTDWYGVGGGEAGWVVSDTLDPNIVYAGEYGGIFTIYDHRTGQVRNVSSYPEDPSGHGAADFRYRFQWTAPIHVSPHNAKVVYHGGNVLFRTADGGQTWTEISGDLTRNDRSKQQWAGGPITGDNTGVETYCTIFAVAESPVQRDLIWVGSDDGLVHLTRDGGKSWKNVTGGLAGIPEWGTISMIEPSRFDAGTAYVVVDNHRLDDKKPYLYRTTNFGESWERLDGSLPPEVYLHAIREDAVDRNLLYLGTERGVSYSTDRGKSWRRLKLNLPTVAVHDLAVKGNTLVVGTHGRSIWAFDHLNLLREMTPRIREAAVHLFNVADATRWQYNRGPADKFAGQNPPDGAVIHYWLKEAAKSDISIEILDDGGKLVTTLSSKRRPAIGYSDNPSGESNSINAGLLSKNAGLNQAVWNLHHAGAELVENGKLDFGGPVFGPKAIPGVYTVRLKVDGVEQSSTLRLHPDPRVTLSAADYKLQLATSLAIRDDVSRLSLLVRQLRSIRQQLASRNLLLKGTPTAADLVREAETLIRKLDELEEQIHNPKAEVVYDILAFKGGAKLYSRIAFLHDVSAEGDGPTPQGVRTVYAEQKSELDRHEAALRSLIGELGILNSTARRLELPHILVPDLDSLRTLR
ncbi:MAG: WD40/YVTN/BNR-like repeat-containing protein [Blastocatellia bacterium]